MQRARVSARFPMGRTPELGAGFSSVIGARFLGTMRLTARREFYDANFGRVRRGDTFAAPERQARVLLRRGLAVEAETEAEPPALVGAAGCYLRSVILTYSHIRAQRGAATITPACVAVYPGSIDSMSFSSMAGSGPQPRAPRAGGLSLRLHRRFRILRARDRHSYGTVAQRRHNRPLEYHRPSRTPCCPASSPDALRETDS